MAEGLAERSRGHDQRSWREPAHCRDRYRAEVRQLLPEPGDVDPMRAHAVARRPAPPARPWLLLSMVASVDGATAIDGLSGGLGGPGDKAVFGALRAVADVILVGAGTARAETYGPPRTPPARQAERRDRGQSPFPRLALVTRSLDLDPSGPMFTESPEPPLIYTVADAPKQRRAALDPVAEVVVGEPTSVDLSGVMADLHRRGARVVMGEGGPTLSGQLAAAGLIDELDLTFSPHLVGGTSPRSVVGSNAGPADLDLAHLWEHDGALFARYVRR